MKEVLLQIQSNDALTESVYEMRLKGDVSNITASGQFVNIKLEGLFLRRPISVCDVENGVLTLLYKVVGKGTEQMAKMQAGESLNVLVGLGNGYDLSLSGEAPVLMGGGVGVPPMYMLAKQLIKQGKKVTAILGFNTQAEVFYEEEFKRLGATVIVTTADGSYGQKGFVTDALKSVDYTYFYTCGPEPMLKAVFKATNTSGQFSFE
ncbi:MAG: dihydroorotate dehydrogenase electron transfer subunit, partial [Clostridia bacterium]|nr:dihydroorotate dehydrogenase electron transfer subunit [Clostridia bacterium]